MLNCGFSNSIISYSFTFGCIHDHVFKAQSNAVNTGHLGVIDLPAEHRSEVPAASLRQYGVEARAEVGEGRKALAPTNACRDAHAFIKRWGLKWKVEASHFKHCKSGEVFEFPYLSPLSFTKFLLQNCPELVTGGVVDANHARQNLEQFWAAFKAIEPQHVFFQQDDPQRKPSNTLAFCLHGDEGRGPKKGNTCVISMETMLGLPDPSSEWDANHCPDCHPLDKDTRRFNIGAMQNNEQGALPLCAKQLVNLRQHSYLTKFVLCVLPNKYYKKTGVLDAFMEQLCSEFRTLFTQGVVVGTTTWFGCVLGLKGDLRWYEKIARLDRCFNKQLGHLMCMCHECAAGSAQTPWEDGSHEPVWGHTLYLNRPWKESNVPPIVDIPFRDDAPEAMLRRDLFHNTRVGILRDLVGSGVMLILLFGYFHGRRGEVSNNREALLERAHSHFQLYCQSTHHYPALHSFTSMFFNAVRSWHYSWVNSKGSDTCLLIGWLKVLAVSCLNDIRDELHRPALETIVKATTCVQGWENILYNHGLWLTKPCAAVLYRHFHDFVQAYNKLAHLCLYTHRVPGFAMKAKLHMLMHTKWELYSQLKKPHVVWVLNPSAWNCDMCEDVVGRVSRLSRRVSPQIPVRRTLDLYLIKCKSVFGRYKSKKPVSKRRLKKTTAKK